MRILIIDEDVKLAYSLKRSLKGYGFKVSLALDGANARKLVEFGV